MEHITRQEFMDSQTRLHKRVDVISESSIKTEQSANAMKETVDKLHDVMFGNGKPGVITRIAQAFVHIKLQYALIFLSVSGLIGVAFFVIKNNLIGK